MNQSVFIGERLREERTRLGMSQPSFGEIGGVTKKTQMLYEGSERFPDAQYLAAVAASGVDVLYVLTGQRSQAVPTQTALPREQQVLLHSYEMCSPAAKKNLLQTAALLATGLTQKADAPSQVSGQSMSNVGSGNVQLSGLTHYSGARQQFNAPVGNVAGADVHVYSTPKKRKP